MYYSKFFPRIDIIDPENRQETLDRWISEDTAKQDCYDSATSAELYCPDCGVLMKPALKTPHNYIDKPLRVLFFYKCPKCGNKKKEGKFGGKEFLPGCSFTSAKILVAQQFPPKNVRSFFVEGQPEWVLR